jgi:hypothetical protein
MKRFQQGLFFEYAVESTHKKVIPKQTWLSKDYLPNIDKARAFKPKTFQDDELWKSTYETLVFDIEVFPNYFLIAFKSIDSGNCIFFEQTDTQKLDCKSVKWIFENYRVIGFNSRSFDIPMASIAVNGASLKQLNDACREIIVFGKKGYEVVREKKAKMLKPNHIDLIEVCPLSGSLKIYGARLHTKQLADLPFPVDSTLSKDQIDIVRWYCFNDLECTQDIYKFLEKDIELREHLGELYNSDLRSKSDAQIAEAVIINEIYRLNGVRPQKIELPSFYSCKYDAPDYLNFKTETLKKLKETIQQSNFTLDGFGSVNLPEELKDYPLKIGQTTYKIGIGGLHSTESKVARFADGQTYTLIDRDVVSYYPFIILNNNLYPEQLGPKFLTVYRTIVEKRLAAKKAKDKRTADSLKITINGSFGKFGNFYSMLYSPKLLIQVTLTGQLSLLYLIEKIELVGICVVSGNTDGIVIACPKNRENELNLIVKEWENETGFETEETKYFCLASRSVNDYMALKDDLTCKGKGKLGRGISKLFKNPDKFICITAIENLLSKSIPIEKTIRECQDIREFIIVRVVKGGGVKDNEYLGKVVRYYYSNLTDSPIVYAKSGNKVPDSDGAMPCMTLPDRLPQDIDFEHYERLTRKMLDEMGLLI